MRHFFGYEFSDGGRAAAGYKGSTGDCVVRAIAILTGEPYKEVYTDMANAMKANGYRKSANPDTAKRGIKRERGQLTVKAVQDEVLHYYGIQRVSLPRGKRPTYAAAYRRYGNCIVSTVKHLSAIVDGYLLDTSDTLTYQMKDAQGNINTHERKAQSVFIPTKYIPKHLK